MRWMCPHIALWCEGWRGCEDKWAPYFGKRDHAATTDFTSQFRPNLCSYSLTSHSHLSTASVGDLCGCCHTYLSVLVQTSSPLLTSVIFTVTKGASFAQQCQSRIQLRIVILETLFHHCCNCDLLFLHRSPTQCFADPMYAVNWNDHSGQSLCSPVNVGAMPIVRVSTSGAVPFGTAATCCRVSIKAHSVCARRAIGASMSALI